MSKTTGARERLFGGLRVGIPSGDTRFFPVQKLLEELGAAVSFAIDRESIPRDDNTLTQIVVELTESYDILLLPLTFPYYGSLRIAETVHRMDLKIRLILVSEAEGLKFTHAVPLFDYYIALSDINEFLEPPPKLVETIQNPSRKRLTERQLNTCISTLLATQKCFIIDYYSGRHPEMSMKATLTHYKNRHYLEDATKDVKEQSDLDEAARNWKLLSRTAINTNERGVVYLIIAMASIVSITAIVAGIAMVYIGGSSGQSIVNIFGQSITTDNVGVAAIFLGVILLLLISRRLIGMIERIKLLH